VLLQVVQREAKLTPASFWRNSVMCLRSSLVVDQAAAIASMCAWFSRTNFPNAER
jgi:hypothetical protein